MSRRVLGNSTKRQVSDCVSVVEDVCSLLCRKILIINFKIKKIKSYQLHLIPSGHQLQERSFFLIVMSKS